MSLFIVAACNSTEGGFERNFAFQPITLPKLPQGSPEYTQGWKDGCETGMAVYGDPMYKTIYKWKRDEDLAAANVTYYKAWKDSYNACRHYLQSWSANTEPSNAFTPFDNKSTDPLFESKDMTGDFLGIPNGENAFSGSGDFLSPEGNIMGF